MLDRINFVLAYLKHFKKNKAFKKSHPLFRLPSDYFLYETYQLDYRQYQEDGQLVAREVVEWSSPYLAGKLQVLEWGCGVSRVIRHLPAFLEEGSGIFACDINEKMIEWCKNNIENVRFETIPYQPPTNYHDAQFDLIYALSVFTHIERELQENWIQEMGRIIKPKGIFLFTTHGSHYFNKLPPSSLKQLWKEGAYTDSYHKKGHRMMSTYNTSEGFRELIEKKFSILEYYAGTEHVEKAGGQDLWIVQRN